MAVGMVLSSVQVQDFSQETNEMAATATKATKMIFFISKYFKLQKYKKKCIFALYNH
jgi:hypothetical protein